MESIQLTIPVHIRSGAGIEVSPEMVERILSVIREECGKAVNCDVAWGTVSPDGEPVDVLAAEIFTDDRQICYMHL